VNALYKLLTYLLTASQEQFVANLMLNHVVSGCCRRQPHAIIPSGHLAISKKTLQGYFLPHTVHQLVSGRC